MNCTHSLVCLCLYHNQWDALHRLSRLKYCTFKNFRLNYDFFLSFVPNTNNYREELVLNTLKGEISVCHLTQSIKKIKF